MKKVDITKLTKGDIILSTSTKPKSKLIQKITKSDISHAMLYVTDGSVIDSTGEGVHARNISKMFYEDTCAIYAYRPIQTLTAEQVDKVVTYVRLEIGSPYALTEAVRSVRTDEKTGGVNQFCSRLVARAYATIGLYLTDNPDFATPADLQRSSKLQQIADVVLSVDLEEIGAVKDQGDTTEGMRAVSNNLLKAARKIDKSVRVLSDIEPLLRLNPQLDAAFAQAFRDSGYLDYWKVEVESHPWRYDPVAMVQLYHGTNEKAALLEECRNVIQRDKEGQFAHWAASLSALETMLQLHPLETFRLQRDLYRTLNFNHKRRVDVANILLRTYGRNDADK